jgi:two-component system response regulator HydG
MSDVGGGQVLVVDDEPNAVKVLSAILSEEGYVVSQAQSVGGAIQKIHEADLDAVITDMKMPDHDGMYLYEYLKEHSPDIPVIFLTAYGTVESAVRAMTHGAFYYFIKPPDYLNLKGILARAVEQRRLRRELEYLRKQLAEEKKGARKAPRISGKVPEIRRILEVVQSIKDSESSVLVCGETGTGKELIAKELHYSAQRKDKPFVAVNCAAIPGELIESELFGYEKGAFTGALSRRIGRVEQASGGTLFLDEIGELELSLQAKLLRVLQEKEIERLGSNQKIQVDFRLVSSTNRDLTKEVQSGSFREDLFYRINVVEINIPPLRDRKDDIPLLASEFLREFCARENKVLALSANVMRLFQNYPWPGNVRQLRNVIERAVVLAKGREITEQELPEEFFIEKKKKPAARSPETLKEMESHAVRDALEKCGGNKSRAARMLGMSRKALYKRLKDFRIS